MYYWRHLTKDQREEVLLSRMKYGNPWHSPPHIQGDKTRFIITSACYEHKDIIGFSPERLNKFEHDLTEVLKNYAENLFAWSVIPNHYHALVESTDVIALLKEIHKLHGRNSFYWNKEEDCKGRRVWCNVLERAIKSDRHFYAALNYIHHNPVKHAYVKKWSEWPYSSATDYIKQNGREAVLRQWNEYDVSDMGENWDDF